MRWFRSVWAARAVDFPLFSSEAGVHTDAGAATTVTSRVYSRETAHSP
jgi:hypothetical protein